MTFFGMLRSALWCLPRQPSHARTEWPRALEVDEIALEAILVLGPQPSQRGYLVVTPRRVAFLSESGRKVIFSFALADIQCIRDQTDGILLLHGETSQKASGALFTPLRDDPVHLVCWIESASAIVLRETGRSIDGDSPN